MNNRLNGKTEIWADGYSFMEMSETLLTALGIRAEEPKPPEPSSRRADLASSTAKATCPGVEVER
ncbi:hypothetical protein [Stutzerimonas xanthomarina]|uniref:Uncharacterized protein n=2 Tax=Stutzerimonas xanthomarina TaxID=271420 RepID=A0A1M5LEL7_9GAMM|nr:hypothetical protein [Stutzerimonas xanthomarina]MCP9340503.1 hypothetical protein [Stutzerimonas xanthomarina]SEH52970.1 hypothetical protein SAMN05216535_0306 [Stutzerimonas xanthomarina]SHG63405.1 hypothetical protein SAMN02744645_1008 [Stutzerimonas xanthomarina DSM 18231]